MYHKKIIIVGKSGSGKDYIMNQLEKNGFKRCIKWTTRPIRKNEINGTTYHFTDNDNFIKNIKEDNFIVKQKIIISSSPSKPIWYYGITNNEFNKSDFMMMTPFEINELKQHKDINKIAFIIYLDIDKKIRESRVLERSDYNDSLKRRFKKDDIDFKDFEDYHLIIKNPEFKIEEVLEKLQ